MKDFKKTFSLMCIAATICGSAVAAHYDGPQVDVDIILHPPAKYDYCARYEESTVKVYRACEFGVDEASRMAQRFAGGQGKIDGYLQGYTWGLYKMATTYQNDSNEMKDGAAIVDSLDQYLQSGINAGIRTGKANGAQEATQEVRNRFYQAVNSGNFPSSKIIIPTITYSGESNAYQKYVGSIITVEQILAETEQALGIYDDYDTVYLGEIDVLTTKDLWGYNGNYKFGEEQWYNKNKALNAWMRLPLSTHAKYQNLNVNAEVDATTGILVVDYQEVFQDAFKNSYSYYVNYYYSINFHSELENGQLHGEAFGIQAGKRVARDKGLAEAFNKKFKESSKLSYADAFRNAYNDAFRATYQDFSNNPKLSLRLVDVVGTINDGVLQAGEEFTVVFKVTNAGGVSSSLRASTYGDIIEGKNQSFNIGKLSKQTFVSKVIGRTDPRLKPRERAVIHLNVNGLTDSINETINNLVEFLGASYDADVVQGSGALVVKTKNISTVAAPTNIVATLKQGGTVINTVYGKVLAAGETESLRLTFDNIDPLELIMNGVSFSAEITFGRAVVDRVSLTIKSSDRDNDLIDYFIQLVNNNAVIPSKTTKTQRLEKVRLILKDLNFAETKRGKKARNDYSKAPNKTIIGKLVAAKKAVTNTTSIIEEFHRMGQLLYPARKNLDQFLFWGKKVDYDKLLNQLSKTGRKRDLR